MIRYPSVGPLWGSEIPARAEILERDVWGAPKKSKRLWGSNDFSGYCRPSLGLGNPARAEILEGDVWGALKIEQHVLLR